jgi:PAS domain S-box-containing protein
MVVVDQAGNIVLLNVQAEKRFGYSRDELLAQKVTAIIPEGFAERLIADGTRTAAEALEQQIGTGIELSGRRKDGSSFPIEIMLSPLDSPEGVLVTAAIRDISVRKKAEAHLAEMESRYRGLLEAAPEAIVISDPNGRILLVNAQMEKVFGYQREELIGESVEILVPERFRAKHPGYRAGYHAHPRARSMGENLDLQGLRKDGREFPVEITLSPLESPEGLLVTAVVRDITERKKFQEDQFQTLGELKRSNEELGHFAYIASHDLQEPLRMVASYTQLLSQRYRGKLDADADDFIAYAVAGCNRMQRLINDLLAYSRAGANAKKPRKISSELALLEALINLETTIVESGAVVTHDELPAVTMDDTHLTQVFQNLIGNAVKYRSAAAPRVHISANTNDSNECVFSVQDNGMGIDSQYFEKIFILFQRLHGRDEFEGTGIGLAVCKKMLERLGGRIWLDSQPDKGSTFHFAVPGGIAK